MIKLNRFFISQAPGDGFSLSFSSLSPFLSKLIMHVETVTPQWNYDVVVFNCRLCFSLLKIAILLLIPPLCNFSACCQEGKPVIQKKDWGVIPTVMLSLQRRGVNGRTLEPATSGLINDDRYDLLEQKNITVPDIAETIARTKCSSLLFPKLLISYTKEE